MALNIFRDTETETQQRSKFADDIVGTFRAGRLDARGNPESLDTWRVTSGDPDVADAIADLLDGTDPAEWETKGEENLEVYTQVDSVIILLEDAKAVRQRFLQRNRSGEIVYTSDGATKDDGEADPHAHLTLDERLRLATDGLGPNLETTIWFRLEDITGSKVRASDLGRFRYQSSGKSIGKAVLRDDIEARLDAAGGPVRAKFAIEKVSFTAKSGPRAGKLVEYNTATLKLLGAAK